MKAGGQRETACPAVQTAQTTRNNFVNWLICAGHWGGRSVSVVAGHVCAGVSNEFENSLRIKRLVQSDGH